ncbi:MAG: hypothetical protein ACOY41_03880 [Pseudomonadota bacterium]
MPDFVYRLPKPSIAIFFLALLLLVLWSFAPGLGGQLIFDDLPNFQPWKDLGDIDSFADVLTFTFSSSGLPGRPLSLLTFLVDDQSWAPDVHALKRTNLALHLLNLCLVFWFSLKVFRCLRPDLTALRGSMLALFAAALWALHPLQVSNVSYVIQRMNLLSTLLELAGLLLFMHGREQLLQSPRQALLLCSIGIGLGMPLAVLAKENGLLLCVFVLLVERFCYAPVRRPGWRLWKLAFLWLPLLAFLGYCISRQIFTAGFGSRHFNAWERLLTQGPVVADYLNKLLLPRLQGSSSLYVDNFPVSHSLIDPPGTLLAWLFLAGLLAGAWLLRQRIPLFSFGVLFYFCGHLMESTILPLELYFEHRNYLPQAGLWLAAAGLLAHATPKLERIAAAAALGFLVLLLVLTRQNALLWSQPELQTEVWYNENPGSLRNTLAFANLLLQRGDFSRTQKVLTDGLKHHPDSLAIAVAQRYVSCYWQDQPTNFDDLPALAKQARYETASIIMLEQIRSLSSQPEVRERLRGCQPASAHQSADIYRAMLANPLFSGGRTGARLNELLAELATASRDLNATMHYYDTAFRAEASPVYPYRQALILLDAGLPDEAAHYAELAETHFTGRRRLLYPELEARLQDLQAALAKSRQSSNAR